MPAQVSGNDSGPECIGCGIAAFKAFGKLKREQYVRQLGLPVGFARIVTLVAGQVVELYALRRRVAGGAATAHVNNAPLRCRHQWLPELPREHEMAKVIHIELLLDAINLFQFLQFHDARIIDEHVERLTHRFYLVGRLHNTVEIRKLNNKGSGSARHTRTGCCRLFLCARSAEHVCAAQGEYAQRFITNTGVTASNQREFARQVEPRRNLFCCAIAIEGTQGHAGRPVGCCAARYSCCCRHSRQPCGGAQ